MEPKVLLTKLEGFEIDSGEPELTFINRLARENDWPLNYAERVYREYMRFIFLMTQSESPLTPSDAVDQAWHLHLAYSRSYWHDLCGELVKRELHHGPTQGGIIEQRKYTDWYECTLRFYKETFGEDPPIDIWLPVAERFNNIDAFKRLDTVSNFVIPKWPIKYGSLILLFILLILGTHAIDPNLGKITGGTVFFGTVFFILYKVWKDISQEKGRNSGGITGGCGGGGGCSGCGGGGCGGG